MQNNRKTKSMKMKNHGNDSLPRNSKRMKNRWKQSAWKELRDEATSHYKCGDYEKAIHHYDRVIITIQTFNSKNGLVAKQREGVENNVPVGGTFAGVSSYTEPHEHEFSSYLLSNSRFESFRGINAVHYDTEMSGDIAAESSSITSINKQAKDILRVTGQNEVIQSFVRNDVGLESEDGTNREPPKNALSKEKKSQGVAWRSNELISPNGSAEKKRDHKEDPGVKSNAAAPLYQQLGRDAQIPDQKGPNRKNAGKWNRRQRLLEEVYTDKDRAAAVNLGSRDIKQSLKLKRRQDRTRILEISEEAHPGTLLALAIHRFKTGDVYVAMKFVDKALELNPYDKNALVARSKCHLMMGNAAMALKDAEQALTEDKSFIKGLYQKAEALYHLAQFEYSLMYFHRGLHIRPQMENFRLGVHKAQQAILNTIGKSVPSFEKFLSQRSQYSLEQNYQSQEILSTKPDAPMKHSNVDKQRDKKLLKELHADKIYLEKLMKNPDLTCLSGKHKPDNKILAEAKEGMEFLQNRQYFWKQQQALISVKAAGSASSKSAKIRSKSAKPLKNASRS